MFGQFTIFRHERLGAGHLCASDYAQRLLCNKTFKCHIFFKTDFCFKYQLKKTSFVIFFFQKLIFLSNALFCKIKFFKQKSFTLIKMLMHFEAFHLTLAERNYQNRERRKKGDYIKKSSSDWLEKAR